MSTATKRRTTSHLDGERLRTWAPRLHQVAPTGILDAIREAERTPRADPVGLWIFRPGGRGQVARHFETAFEESFRHLEAIEIDFGERFDLDNATHVNRLAAEYAERDQSLVVWDEAAAREDIERGAPVWVVCRSPHLDADVEMKRLAAKESRTADSLAAFAQAVWMVGWPRELDAPPMPIEFMASKYFLQCFASGLPGRAH